MLEELEMIKELVGQLTGAGLWVVGGVIGYKLIINLILMFGGGWLAHSFVSRVFDHIKPGITKEEGEHIRAENTELRARKEADAISHRVELDEVKAMYKILKEAKNDNA